MLAYRDFISRIFQKSAIGMTMLGMSMQPTSAGDEPLVDCHVHVWQLSRPAGLSWLKKDDPILYKDFLPPAFEEIAKANGVTGVVLVQAGQSLPDNQWNLDISKHNPSLFRGVVGNLSEVIGTDAFAPLFSELCKDPRYLGYRLSGRYQEGLSEALFRDLTSTAKAGKAVDFLAGGYSLADIRTIAQRLPQLRIMVNHMGNLRLDGKPLNEEWAKDFRELAKQPNVVCKISALYGRVEKQPAPKDLEFYRPILDLCFECYGEDRLIYGSDWPVAATTGDYASLLALTRSYFNDKGVEVNAKVFHRNAMKFYAIPTGK